MRIAGFIVAAALLSSATPVWAADPPKPGAAAPATDPRAEALVRRYLKAIYFERTIDDALGAMLPVMAEQARRQNPNLTEEQSQMLIEVVRKVLREKMTPQMIDRMV